MLISLATAPNPGRVNEDFVVAGPGLVVVLDGAGLLVDLDTGCFHGVPWFVQRLGAELFGRATRPEAELTDCLADAILAVSRLHAGSCDLGNPLTPSATVAIARARDELFEWLVLADSTLALTLPDGVRTISDHRVSQVTDEQRSAMAAELRHLDRPQRLTALVHAQRRVMNTPEGYWAAASDPKAAAQALTGSVPLSQVRTAALLTDGAARAVDDFGLLSWPELLDRLEATGPEGLIDFTRELERSDPDRLRWPRGKKHDDATAVLMRPQER